VFGRRSRAWSPSSARCTTRRCDRARSRRSIGRICACPDDDGAWGSLTLAGSNPETSAQWTDDGTRSARQLKHRAAKDTRIVPVAPPLVALYRWHLDEYGTAPDGRLFRGGRGGAVPVATYGSVWRKARQRALSPAEVVSPLAATPYDLRHAAVSLWLNAGVPPTQIAEWAGHSVAVLLHTYAKCIVGQDEAARLRIGAALGLEGPAPKSRSQGPEADQDQDTHRARTAGQSRQRS